MMIFRMEGMIIDYNCSKLRGSGGQVNSKVCP